MKNTIVSFLAAVSVFSFAPTAQAASDYYMKIEGVDGESSSSSSSIDVLSWSWGASNAGSMSAPAGTGRVASPRDAASGLATGKRQHKPLVCRVGGGDCDDLSTLDRVAEVQGFSVTLDQASAGALGRCAGGKHFPKATLTARDGSTIELSNVDVSACTASPPVSSRQATAACVSSGQCPSSTGTVTLTLTGEMRHTKTGHVTLMK